MQFLSTFVSLSACLLLSTQIGASPHKADPNPLNQVYIMKQQIDYSRGFLDVFGQDGTVVYRFAKNVQDPLQGDSKTVLMTPSLELLSALGSTNDICGHKTTYTEYDLPLSSKKHFTIDPNGLLKDEWTFNFVDRSGKRQNFKFNRNFSSKEGKIYPQIKGEDGELIAELRDQERTDAFLTTPSVHEVATYTLFCTADSPQFELVFLMGLVLSRVHECGI
ncbi:hypothetical protein PGT21_022295 [Puccinia graminis f. sp. tritici]|uniref:Uncharacterized protein n=2 Tax=Puccinia graminis f. sp. tritici TaxID=56615 RepID=E3KDP4_PUCGT|nr:uncharacterized protein PGTG_08436 [Puccinia graminis f. sp. tritici CRL 75-36-700-3]EFP82480.2 hypothetical protein PGTG_08436 [Puccinia graminis f. sp. tritici CRL 75-36-700-3]KAA1079717.1 hypothetical protein PGT21_022295 [Puccinia graminis f. sp. tritici]